MQEANFCDTFSDISRILWMVRVLILGGVKYWKNILNIECALNQGEEIAKRSVWNRKVPGKEKVPGSFLCFFLKWNCSKKHCF